MVFFGVGMLMTFLKKYSYSAVGYNLFTGAVVVQWAILCSAWISQTARGEKEPMKVKLTVRK